MVRCLPAWTWVCSGVGLNWNKEELEGDWFKEELEGDWFSLVGLTKQLGLPLEALNSLAFKVFKKRPEGPGEEKPCQEVHVQGGFLWI